MITTKKKPETEKEHAHVEIHYNGVYLGYCIKNSGALAVVGENYNFVSKSKLPNFYKKLKRDIFIEAERLAKELDY